MKKKLNNKGFALVETLVCALFIVAVFIVIFENYIPIMAKYDRYENYDDIDSKYLAYYIKYFIEIDTIDVKQNIHNKLTSGSVLYRFKPGTGYAGSDEIESTNKPNELCTMLSKENRQKCQSFVDGANITNIYLVDYNTANLKSKISQQSDISRAFELYVNYMPSFAATSSSKPGYKRIIVEIKHSTKDEAEADDVPEKVYYNYANIELSSVN